MAAQRGRERRSPLSRPARRSTLPSALSGARSSSGPHVRQVAYHSVCQLWYSAAWIAFVISEACTLHKVAVRCSSISRSLKYKTHYLYLHAAQGVVGCCINSPDPNPNPLP